MISFNVHQTGSLEMIRIIWKNDKRKVCDKVGNSIVKINLDTNFVNKTKKRLCNYHLLSSQKEGFIKNKWISCLMDFLNLWNTLSNFKGALQNKIFFRNQFLTSINLFIKTYIVHFLLFLLCNWNLAARK